MPRDPNLRRYETMTFLRWLEILLLLFLIYFEWGAWRDSWPQANTLKDPGQHLAHAIVVFASLVWAIVDVVIFKLARTDYGLDVIDVHRTANIARFRAMLRVIFFVYHRTELKRVTRSFLRTLTHL